MLEVQRNIRESVPCTTIDALYVFPLQKTLAAARYPFDIPQNKSFSSQKASGTGRHDFNAQHLVQSENAKMSHIDLLGMPSSSECLRDH